MFSLGLSADYASPLSFSVEGVGRNMVAMSIEGILLFVFVLLIEYNFFLPSLWSRGSPGPVSHEGDEDKDVARERRRISRGRASESVLWLENLTKVVDTCSNTASCRCKSSCSCSGLPVAFLQFKSLGS